MQNPRACRESSAERSLRQVFKILHRVRTSWLLVISHTLLTPSGKGLGNSSIYLKQADRSYVLPATRKLCRAFQYRNRAAPDAKFGGTLATPYIYFMGRCEDSLLQGWGKSTHTPWSQRPQSLGAVPTPAVPLSWRKASRAGG